MCDYASYRPAEGWQEVEPELGDPLKRWKATPVKKRKDMEFLEDVVR